MWVGGGVQEKGNLLRRIAEQRAGRETALKQQRSRREMAELADCTFRPTRVSSAPAPPTVPPAPLPLPHLYHQIIFSSQIMFVFK